MVGPEADARKTGKDPPEAPSWAGRKLPSAPLPAFHGKGLPARRTGSPSRPNLLAWKEGFRKIGEFKLNL